MASTLVKMDPDLKYNKVCKKCHQGDLDWFNLGNISAPNWALHTKKGEKHWDTCPFSYSTSNKIDPATGIVDKEYPVPAGSNINPCAEIKLGPDGKIIEAKTYTNKINNYNTLAEAEAEMESSLMKVVEHAKEEMEEEESDKSKEKKIAFIKKVMNRKKIKLVTAKTLYQPVYGTSNDTKYYLIMKFNGMNLAIRPKKLGPGGGISLRVEGAFNSSSYSHGLDVLNFSTQPTYRSCHIAVQTCVHMKMIIGAIAGLFADHLVSDVGNIDYILGDMGL